MLLYLLIILVSLIINIYFFRKCAGTLHIGKLNLMSVIFYLYLVQVFIGAAMVILGYDQHYTLSKLIDRESSIKTMFYVVAVTSVIWPLCMWGFLRLFRVNANSDYSSYLQEPTSNKQNTVSFWIIFVVGIISILLLTAYLYKLGYIPLVKLIQRPSGFDFSTQRIIINGTYIINVYVRNILVLLAIPVIAYVSFAFTLTTKSIRWIIMAVIFFVASLITKTYNFEKTPIVFHLMVYALIYIYFAGGIKTKWMIPILAVGGVLVFVAYGIVSNGVQHSLYDGIGGRLFFSQLGALTYNFDLFPNVFPFLEGRSIAPTVLKLFGNDPEMHLRSARLIMEYYSPAGVYEGVAGVMNSFYIGEAYANFGWGGAAFSVVWTAFVISGLYALTLKIRKTPVTIALSAYIAINVAITINGGFMDFIYNISWIIVIGGLLILEYLPEILSFFKKIFRIADKK